MTAADLHRFENPYPFRWNCEQYYHLGGLGVFGDCRVELLDGVVIEKYPNDPADPSPRPFRFSREQYRRLGELGFFDGHRVELVRGEIVLLPRVPESHVAVVTLAADALRAAFGANHYVRARAPLELGTITPEPAVAVVPGGPRDYLLAPTTAPLVVEVGDTRLLYATVTKTAEYATAGIPEYWVIDVATRRLMVFRDPQPSLDGGAAYRTRTVLNPGDTVSPLAAPTATIAVADLLP